MKQDKITHHSSASLLNRPITLTVIDAQHHANIRVGLWWL